MDKLRQQANRGYLISGIGALVALLAFLLLPYASAVLTCSSNCSGVTSASISMDATLIAQATNTTNQSSGYFSGSTIPFQGQGALWFLPILSVVALVLVGFLIYRDMPFGKVINAPAATQKKGGSYALIGVAALGILIQIILIANLGSVFQTAFAGSSTNVAVSASGGFGFWLYLLGMLAVAGGMVLLIIQNNRSAQVASPYPYQSTQATDPYAQQNPISQYPPASYPPQASYPPASYPPQASYPPGQYPPQPPYPSGQ